VDCVQRVTDFKKNYERDHEDSRYSKTWLPSKFRRLTCTHWQSCQNKIVQKGEALVRCAPERAEYPVADQRLHDCSIVITKYTTTVHVRTRKTNEARSYRRRPSVNQMNALTKLDSASETATKAPHASTTLYSPRKSLPCIST